jgi:hypothetical protein
VGPVPRESAILRSRRADPCCFSNKVGRSHCAGFGRHKRLVGKAVLSGRFALGFVVAGLLLTAGCGQDVTQSDPRAGDNTWVATLRWNHGATDVFPRTRPVLADRAGSFTKRNDHTRLKVTWQGSIAMEARRPGPSASKERFSLCAFFLKIDKRHSSVEKIIQGHRNRLAVYVPTLVDFFDKIPAGKHTVTIWVSAPFHDAPLCNSNAGGNPQTIFVEEMPVP